MAKQQNQQAQQPPQFSDPDLERIKRYGRALDGVTPFDEEVERHLENLGSHERHEYNYAKIRANRRLG